jgi:hypothetical protein
MNTNTNTTITARAAQQEPERAPGLASLAAARDSSLSAPVTVAVVVAPASTAGVDSGGGFAPVQSRSETLRRLRDLAGEAGAERSEAWEAVRDAERDAVDEWRVKLKNLVVVLAGEGEGVPPLLLRVRDARFSSSNASNGGSGGLANTRAVGNLSALDAETKIAHLVRDLLGSTMTALRLPSDSASGAVLYAWWAEVDDAARAGVIESGMLRRWYTHVQKIESVALNVLEPLSFVPIDLPCPRCDAHRFANGGHALSHYVNRRGEPAVSCQGCGVEVCGEWEVRAFALAAVEGHAA